MKCKCGSDSSKRLNIKGRKILGQELKLNFDADVCQKCDSLIYTQKEHDLVLHYLELSNDDVLIKYLEKLENAILGFKNHYNMLQSSFVPEVATQLKGRTGVQYTCSLLETELLATKLLKGKDTPYPELSDRLKQHEEKQWLDLPMSARERFIEYMMKRDKVSREDVLFCLDERKDISIVSQYELWLASAEHYQERNLLLSQIDLNHDQKESVSQL